MKTIPNFSRYSIDENGNIYSNNYKNSGKTKILKPAISKDGYLATMLLSDDGKYCSRKLHRWVMTTYIGERKKGYEINHKDGNKLNNSIQNLEYITKSENIKHAYKLGFLTPKIGSLNGNSKLNEQEVKEIREHASNHGRYYGRKELAKKYSVSEGTIKDIITRRKNMWKNV